MNIEDEVCELGSEVGFEEKSSEGEIFLVEVNDKLVGDDTEDKGILAV